MINILFYKKVSIYILPPSGTIRLLYTNHSGYTWIDETDNDDDPHIYYNQNNNTYVKKIRSKLNNRLANTKHIDHMDSDIDSGCFVFEISEDTFLHFRDLLYFSNELTEMNFCGCFDLGTLYEVKYFRSKKAVVIMFDTESG